MSVMSGMSGMIITSGATSRSRSEAPRAPIKAQGRKVVGSISSGRVRAMTIAVGSRGHSDGPHGMGVVGPNATCVTMRVGC